MRLQDLSRSDYCGHILATRSDGGYDAVTRLETRPDQRFILIAYGAKSAFGLVATEHNGIAVLDVETRLVVCDAIAQSGFGLSEAQLAEFDRLLALPDPDFRTFVNTQPGIKYQI